MPKSLINIIDEIGSQIAFEKQRDLTAQAETNGWTPDYHKGYIDGLAQAQVMLQDYACTHSYCNDKAICHNCGKQQ